MVQFNSTHFTSRDVLGSLNCALKTRGKYDEFSLLWGHVFVHLAAPVS